MLEQSIPERLYPMERTHARTVLEEMQHVGMKEIILCEGPHSGAEEECEENGAVETKLGELTLMLIPSPSSRTTQGRGSTRV